MAVLVLILLASLMTQAVALPITGKYITIQRYEIIYNMRGKTGYFGRIISMPKSQNLGLGSKFNTLPVISLLTAD